MEKKDWVYRIAHGTILVFLTGMVFRTLYHVFISSDGYLGFVTDDFYYYYLPAKNLALHGISSFDGITITNGYHPLWMIFLSGLCLITSGNEQFFFVLLSLVSALSSYCTFRILWKLTEEIFPKRNIVPAAIMVVMAVLTGLVFLGMEITFTIPLYAYLLLRVARLGLAKILPRKEILLLGFFSSLLILSRLDTGLLILLMLIIFPAFYKHNVKQSARFYALFCAGGILVLGYFLSNYILFGHLMTVSSASKTLKMGHSFNFSFLKYLAMTRDGLGGLILIPIGFGLLILRKNRIPERSHMLICWLVLCFPVLYYATLLLGSDWFLNRWYLYPLPFCTFIVAGICCNSFFTRMNTSVTIFYRSVFILVSACILFFSFSLVLRDTIHFKAEPNSIYANAKKMLPFVSAHPGIYAMGDQAGLMAYLLKVPVIQLEGLAADYTMYEHIKHEDDLSAVLKEYHIDYLIETSDKSGLPKENGCYTIEEPHAGQAGMLSRKMKGIVCTEPIYKQTTSNDEGYEVNTYVFEVRH